MATQKIRKKLAIQYAAEGNIEKLKMYHSYAGNNNLLYYALKNDKLDCAKFILGLYPNSKIELGKLSTILIKFNVEVVEWVIKSDITEAGNKILLGLYVRDSIAHGGLIGKQKSLDNLQLAKNLGCDVDKAIDIYWPENQSITNENIKNIVDTYRIVLKRISKLAKL